jgi:hypothetical protein
LVQSSNFYRASEIPGKFTSVEREANIQEKQSGVTDLNAEIAENSNFINKLMKALHN